MHECTLTDTLGAAEGAGSLRVTIHDLVPHGEEVITLKGLSEEVSEIVNGIDIRHGELTVFDAFTDEEVSTLDVLNALMMFWIVREIYSGLVVAAELDWVICTLEPQLSKEAT